MPKLGLGLANTGILLSSKRVRMGKRALRATRTARHGRAIAIAIALGATFVAIQLKEWADHPYGLTTNLYGSLYFTITGFHMMYVLVGLVVLAFLLLWTALGYFDRARSAALTIGGHFVDVVWLFIFATLYLSPFMCWRGEMNDTPLAHDLHRARPGAISLILGLLLAPAA